MLRLYEVSCLRDFRKRFTTAWQVYTTRWNDPRHMLWGTMFMWNWYSFMDGNTVRADCAPFEKGCTVKGKSLVPVGANSFFKSRPLFWRGLVCRKGNRKSQKVIFFVNNCGKCTKVCSPFKWDIQVDSRYLEFQGTLKYFDIPVYQICKIEEKLIRVTTFNKYICNRTLEVRDILKILWKREQFLLSSTIFFACC